MKIKIVVNAHFTDYGDHGYMVFRDGTTSEKISDENSAFLAINKALEEKKVSFDEAEFLKAMVKSIKIPDSFHVLDVAMDIVNTQQKGREAILFNSPYFCGNNLVH